MTSYSNKLLFIRNHWQFLGMEEKSPNPLKYYLDLQASYQEINELFEMMLKMAIDNNDLSFSERRTFRYHVGHLQATA